MDVSRDIENCCSLLESHKITSRRQGYDRFNEIIHDRRTISYLRGETGDAAWNNILTSIQTALAKDADKKIDEIRKNPSSGSSGAPIRSADLFFNFIRITLKEGFIANAKRVVDFIMESMQSANLRKCYEQSFIKTLTQCILNNSSARSKLQASHWEYLFMLLKNLITSKTLDNEQIRCFTAIIKYGPICNLPVHVFRQEFKFVGDICQSVTFSSPMPQLESVLELAQYFCKHAANDNRMACCRLGEDVFDNFTQIFENSKGDKKSILVDFFLLQVSIHHPKGVTREHPAAYAFDWPKWMNCLIVIYSVLSKDVDSSLHSILRSQWFFEEQGNVRSLTNNFVLLYVEVCRQIFGNETLDLSVALPENEERPCKKQKIEVGISTLIEKVKDTKYWPWINLTCAVIENHPQALSGEDFSNLLEILKKLISEEMEINLRHHLYKFLIVMEDVEKQIDLTHYATQVEKMWEEIANLTLHSIDSNLTQVLLQRLIEKNCVKADNIFQNFRQNSTLKVTEYTLGSLEIAFKKFHHLQSDNELKKEAVGWILNTNNLKNNKMVYCQEDLARILVCLVLKQWPETGTFTEFCNFESSLKRPFGDIENIYLTTNFENLVRAECNKEKLCPTNLTFCADARMKEFLLEALKVLSKSYDFADGKVDQILEVAVLLTNVNCFLMKYEIINDATLKDFTLYRLLMLLVMPTIFNKLDLKIKDQNEDSYLEKIFQNVKLLKMLFSKNVSKRLALDLREAVPQNILKQMFEGIAESDTGDSERFCGLKTLLVECLVYFSCLPDLSEAGLNVQKFAFSALLSNSYDCTSDSNFNLVVVLLSCLKTCGLKKVSCADGESLYNLFQVVCESRYESYEGALKILELFYDIFPIIAQSDYEGQNNFVAFLEPFYDSISNYGPAVSVALLKCMGLLFEIDPDCNFSKWGAEEIFLKIPQFLISDYQEVRLAAIENLVKFFKISSDTGLLRQFHKQEIMFSNIYEMNIKVFEIVGSASDERRIDETVTRSSSVLHTFSAVMVTCNLWIGESLFTLLKIVCDKRLSVQSLKKIINLVSKTLNFDSTADFLEKYLIPVFNLWKNYPLHTFPFQIYSCGTREEFYAKFWGVLSPIIVTVENNREIIDVIARKQQKTVADILEDAGPRLLAYCIANENSDTEKILKNKIYKLLVEVLGKEKVFAIFTGKIHEVVLNLSEFLTDEIDYKEKFGENIIFPKFHDLVLNISQFYDCVQFIENTLYSGEALMLNLIRVSPDKIPCLLLALKLNINDSKGTEEKLKNFHVFSTIAMLVLESVFNEPSMQQFLIRDLTYTLLHFIKRHKSQPKLAEVSCKFFKKILVKLLPDLADVLENFLSIVVGRLKILALENDSPLRSPCLEMMELLLVENTDLFLDQIEKLDNFPETPEFSRILSVHRRIKYESKKVSLETEILEFLDFAKSVESLDECEYGLQHVRSLLGSKKVELKLFYDNLRTVGGFSEGCQNSVLHQLICVLVRLSCSENKNVSIEAARCLGEIGPADLSTLVLQPESPLPDPKWSAWELISGHVISLLTNYIVDPDINVTIVASEILFKILATKEGKKVAQSDTDFGFGVINCEILVPFFSKVPQRNSCNLTIDGDMFSEKIDDRCLWITTNTCHKSWIRSLVCSFLETLKERNFFESFIKLSRIKTEFCENILPLLIYQMLTLKTVSVHNIISERIQEFFDEHWKITVGGDKSVNIVTNKSSVNCMLNVVNFLRLQRNVKSKNQMRDLQLDYLRVAKAAQYCSAHFTALLYAELWCQEQVNLSPEDFHESTCGSTKLDIICEKLDERTEKALQNILRSGYKSVGETDALMGCGTSHLLDPKCRVEYYKELGRWEQVTHRYEVEISHGENSVKPLMESLENSNLYQLSLFCSKWIDEPHYESLWRLSQWDYKICNNDNSNQTNCEKYKFYAFKCLHEKDEFGFNVNLEGYRNSVVGRLSDANLRSCKNFYSMLTQLQGLKEVEEFANVCGDENETFKLVTKWKFQDEITQNDFQYVEPIKTQRIVLLSEFLKKTSSAQNVDVLKNFVVDLMLNFAEYARVEGHCNIASRTLESLRRVSGLSNDVVAKVQLEEANLCWSIQDVTSAKCILRQLCNNENVNPRLNALALKMTGKWLVAGSSENRQTIIENYFLKSLTRLNNLKDGLPEDEKFFVDTFDQLAKFSDREYQQVMSHIKSDSFQKKKENFEKSKQTVENFKSTKDKKSAKDNQKAIHIKMKFSVIDEAEIKKTEMEKDNLLKFALKYYLLNLIRSDDHNITIFRVISLLLENRSSPGIRNILETELVKIPSYKFIDILPQMIPHIFSPNNDSFSETVTKIIEKCAQEHPYHTLPLILALANAKLESKEGVNDERTKCAKMILTKLIKNTHLGDLIKKMQLVSEALIELAYIRADGAKIPKNAKVLKVKNYDDVLLPTVHLAVQRSCVYDKIIGIRGWEEGYQNVGGVNLPKRVTCLGTDGLKRSQLVKGQDDLRQDAVMQQVFTIINSLLTVNKQTKELRIRTYKIVPLSMRSGILEWVANSTPIGNYLTWAHEKYRPNDRNPRRCKEEFGHLAREDNEKKMRGFKKICRQIQPVFHKFFEESFPQPTVWYERRRAYTRSVATTSMCGYILGIGDRHVSNIVIDTNTAELIHIDFGIAFEQGRCLPTPETVPFRLTRDIVDGMGVSGVEGVFRRSCEKTMEVLRSNHQTIMTILEVLLYDPLYDWTVTTAEANKRQYDDEESQFECSQEESNTVDVNVTAERALLRLGAKLQGTENGQLSTVEHQVGTLIQQAVDPFNLCRLYHGWQPFL